MRVAVAALAIAALLSLSAAVRVAAQPAEPLIRVGLGPEDDSKPLVYAVQAGLFQKAGLNVELNNLAGSAVIAAALAGGSLEIGKGSPAGVISAFAKGLPFTIIGGSAFYTTSSHPVAMVVSAKSEVKTAQDLAGTTLGAVTLQDLSTLATYAWLNQNGVDWKSPKFIEMPASRALASMESNRAVGMTVYEPILSADLATGEVRIIGYPFDAIGKHFSMGVLFANANWVGAHLGLVERFLRVMRQADAYVSGHESETAVMLAQFGGADPAVLARIRHPERGAVIEPGDLQPVIDIMAKYNVIPGAFRAETLICSCAPRR